MMTGLTADDAAALADEFEASFRSSLLAYWYPRAIDPDGGYRVAWDRHGRPLARDPRSVVSQSRTVYLFARAARAGIRADAMLTAAVHGLQYLRDVAWDGTHGGFAWSREDPRKLTYGQVFVVFACAELVRAGGPADAGELALRTLDVLDRHAHDPEHGGYREIFRNDWSALPLWERSPIDAHHPHDKTINTQLHVLEATVHAHRAGIDERAADRAAEIVDVLTRKAARRRYAAPMTDAFTAGWHPRPRARDVRYGHCLELAWMLLDARDVVEGRPGADRAAMEQAAVSMGEETERHGVDRASGGVLEHGPLGRPATVRRFEGWAQAEALLGYLWLHRHTGDPRWAQRLRETWGFVRRYVIDHEVGEWHEYLDADLVGSGPKGGAWASGYHVGRALLDGADLLRDGYAESP